MTIAPDIPPNSDIVLILSILLQSPAIVFIARIIYYQFNKSRIQAAAVVKQEKRRKMDDWLDGSQKERE